MALACEPALVTLRERLAAERERGAAFTGAWRRSRKAALDGLSWHQRGVWSSALADTRWAWRSAYYGGRSSRRASAVTELEAYAADGELDALRHEPARS